MRVLGSALSVLLACLAVMAGPAATAAPSESDGSATLSKRDVPAFQSARNRQIKTRTLKFVRVCPGCKSGVEVPSSFFSKQAKAKISVTASTYKILDQNKKYDFFLVDLTSGLTERKGDQDWGWYDVTLTSTGTTKILGSSYSTGRKFENVDKCTRFPVSLGVGFYGVSVGTTVGHVSFCNDGSRLVQSSVTGGQKYHATGVTGIQSLQSQRYVRVAQGKTPSFKVQLTTNADRFSCYTVSDGTHCFVHHAMQSKSLTIGTTPQT